jgi:hypothetical protein
MALYLKILGINCDAHITNIVFSFQNHVQISKEFMKDRKECYKEGVHKVMHVLKIYLALPTLAKCTNCSFELTISKQYDRLRLLEIRMHNKIVTHTKKSIILYRDFFW